MMFLKFIYLHFINFINGFLIFDKVEVYNKMNNNDITYYFTIIYKLSKYPILRHCLLFFRPIPRDLIRIKYKKRCITYEIYINNKNSKKTFQKLDKMLNRLEKIKIEGKQLSKMCFDNLSETKIMDQNKSVEIPYPIDLNYYSINLCFKNSNDYITINDSFLYGKYQTIENYIKFNRRLLENKIIDRISIYDILLNKCVKNIILNDENINIPFSQLLH